ncbi:nucleophosmin-like [Ambystoma mexicanum]|uniref:nucleophosmin-like n=1 Tax=Ambystoma mexicanum TaxID=8296 RepID=UPI0037E909E5
MAGAALKRTHTFLFGCTLTSNKKKFFFPGGEDLEEQLSLRTVCLGLGARDEMHVLAAEGEGRSGALVRVPVAALRPSLQSAILVGDLDLLPPVTFCLVSGSGPLHISAEHLVASGGCGDATRSSVNGQCDAVHAGKKASGRRRRLREQPCPAKEGFQHATVQTSSEELNACKGQKDVQDATVQTAIEEQGTCMAEKQDVQDAAVQTEAQEEPPQPVQEKADDASVLTAEEDGQGVAGAEVQTPFSEKPVPVPTRKKKALTVAQIRAEFISNLAKGSQPPKLFTNFQKYIKYTFNTENPQVVEELWQLLK